MSPKDRRGDALFQSRKLSSVDEGERLDTQHVSGDDEEGTDCEMASAKERPDEWESAECVLVVVSERGGEVGLLREGGGARPDLVVMPVD